MDVPSPLLGARQAVPPTVTPSASLRTETTPIAAAQASPGNSAPKPKLIANIPRHFSANLRALSLSPGTPRPAPTQGGRPPNPVRLSVRPRRWAPRIGVVSPWILWKGALRTCGKQLPTRRTSRPDAHPRGGRRDTEEPLSYPPVTPLHGGHRTAPEPSASSRGGYRGGFDASARPKDKHASREPQGPSGG